MTQKLQMTSSTKLSLVPKTRPEIYDPVCWRIKKPHPKAPNACSVGGVKRGSHLIVPFSPHPKAPNACSVGGVKRGSHLIVPFSPHPKAPNACSVGEALKPLPASLRGWGGVKPGSCLTNSIIYFRANSESQLKLTVNLP